MVLKPEAGVFSLIQNQHEMSNEYQANIDYRVTVY